MIRKLATLMMVVAFAFLISGCQENEHKIHEEQQTQTESEPQDVSPGTMIVE